VLALHELEQDPHRAGLLFRSASQPLSGLPSQSAKPVSQLGTQTPALQALAPCAAEQTRPQVPQWLSSFSDCSQPLLGSASQSAFPWAHAAAQRPAWQRVVPFGLTHCTSHRPQVESASAVLASQPLFDVPSQSA
jgi:hypothetical protein